MLVNLTGWGRELKNLIAAQGGNRFMRPLRAPALFGLWGWLATRPLDHLLDALGLLIHNRRRRAQTIGAHPGGS